MLRLYDFECTLCGRQFEKICHTHEKVWCTHCYADTKKLPSRFNVNMGVGAYGYYDETLDKYIPTNKARKEECKKQGVTPSGETPKPDGEAWF